MVPSRHEAHVHYRENVVPGGESWNEVAFSGETLDVQPSRSVYCDIMCCVLFRKKSCRV